MVNVGSTGSLGSEWALKDARRAGLSNLYGQDISFVESVNAFGIDVNAEIDAIATELQFTENDDMDSQFDLLDFGNRVFNQNDCIFQSSDAKVYTDFDLKNGTYAVNSEQQFAASMGVEYKNEEDKPYDFITLSNNAIEFTDLVFAGAADGKNDKLSVNLTRLQDLKWNNVSFNVQDIDDTDVKCIEDTVPQYVVDQIKAGLTNYKEGTKEYNEKFLEIAAALMDQEGYTNGKVLPEAGKTNVEQSSKVFDVVRDENGRVRIMLNTEDEVKVKGAGTVKGSGMFSLGVTSDDAKESVIQVGNTDKNASLNITLSDKVNNLEAFGHNVNADVKSSLAGYYNINWNVNKGSLDASDSKSTLYIDAAGKGNVFDLNEANAYIVDENKSKNTYNWKGNSIK